MTRAGRDRPLTRAREEGGWALVIAMMVMTMMAGFTAATLAFVNNEQKQSAVSRQRDTSFNYAESAMNAQIHALALTGGWPAGQSVQYPTSCTQASTDDAKCPTASTLQAMFPTPDAASDAKWTTMVRDNSGVSGAQTFWTEAMVNASPTYDANGDDKVWVRAQSTVRGHTRTMVALVAVQRVAVNLPHDTLLSGRLTISNNGNKVIIDTQGTSASVGPVQVRCTPTPGETQPCLGHSMGNDGTPQSLQDSLDNQISPNQSQGGYTLGSALSADTIAQLEAEADAFGTYYTSCPASLSGAVVVIDTPNPCSYGSNPVFNSPSSPGILIVTQGSLSLAGTVDFNGVVYHTNENDSSGDLVTLGGNAIVHGSIFVDGDGGLVAGSSGKNIQYSEPVFQGVTTFGNAGLIQNTWREIRGS